MMSIDNQLIRYQGGCLCGEIRYSVGNLGRHMGHCHCSMCRKFHGAAFATFGEASKEQFQWLSGESFLKTYVASNGTKRTFCSHCGSSLLFKSPNMPSDIVEFSLGTLDTDIPYKPDAHIFIENKACWYEIEQPLPQYAQGRDSSRVDAGNN
ncbi:GFA family protein [Eionea flava]